MLPGPLLTFLDWGGSLSCVAGGILSLVAISKGRSAQELAGVREIDSLSELKELVPLVPLLVAVAGRVACPRPLSCELGGPASAVVEVREERRGERRAGAVWVGDSDPVRLITREAPWAVRDPASSAELPVQEGRAAGGDALEPVGDIFLPAQDSVVGALVGELAGRRHLGTRVRERALPVDAAVTAIGELALAPDQRDTFKHAHHAPGGKMLVLRAPGGDARGEGPFLLSRQPLGVLVTRLQSDAAACRRLSWGLCLAGAACIAAATAARILAARRRAAVRRRIEAARQARAAAAAQARRRVAAGQAGQEGAAGAMPQEDPRDAHTAEELGIHATPQRPDATGRYGQYGGKYVPETLITALTELEAAYAEALADPSFVAELEHLLKTYVGRPSPLYHAERLSEHYRRADGSRPEIYLKREDLNHTGAHKINNSLGQALLCKRMGKRRIIAETGAGQHGVATATVCARQGLDCVVYMGTKDMERQKLNVFRMRLLGAEVRPVSSGTCTLKDACSEAIRDWVTNVESSHYILGSVAGPHPYPMMVRDFQAVIGKELREQAHEIWDGADPDVLVACVGGGSNAMGMFHEFVEDAGVRLIGVEAAGHGIDTDKHAATLTLGRPGVLHGSMSYVIQDDEGQIVDPHSISAGLDYPGVGPEHSYLKDTGRAEYVSITDDEALAAFQRLSRLEGIIPALESSHALAYLEKLCPTLPGGTRVVVNCSGRGDKDVQQVIEHLEF